MARRQSDDARLMALHLLGQVLDDGVSLGDADESRASDPRNRAYARHLAYGVLRWLDALDWLAGHLLSKPLKRKDRDIHRLVLLGLFQLWKDGTAGHAAVNETAGCARKLGKPWATGLYLQHSSWQCREVCWPAYCRTIVVTRSTEKVPFTVTISGNTTRHCNCLTR